MLSISMPPSRHQTLPPWLNTDINLVMLPRDKFRKQKKFVEYKQRRNHVSYLVREAKKKYFSDLAGNNATIIIIIITDSYKTLFSNQS